MEEVGMGLRKISREFLKKNPRKLISKRSGTCTIKFTREDRAMRARFTDGGGY
jgi:hypothetical protein